MIMEKCDVSLEMLKLNLILVIRYVSKKKLIIEEIVQFSY